MSVYDTHVPEGGGNLYLKIKDGETVKIRIASEPAIFESESKPNADGKTTISTRYAWVVWNQTEESAQILQQSATFFRNIAVLAQDEDWGDPTGYDIKIKREGATFNDTKYIINASPNREPLSTEAKAAIAEIDLLAKIKASPFARNIFMVADFDKKSQDGAKPITSAPAAKVKPDVVIEDIGDEPVNLDDIPF